MILSVVGYSMLQELYRSGSSLREKIGSLKDRVREERTSMDQLKERRKEAIARKDAIQKGGFVHT